MFRMCERGAQIKIYPQSNHCSLIPVLLSGPNQQHLFPGLLQELPNGSPPSALTMPPSPPLKLFSSGQQQSDRVLHLFKIISSFPLRVYKALQNPRSCDSVSMISYPVCMTSSPSPPPLLTPLQTHRLPPAHTYASTLGNLCLGAFCITCASPEYLQGSIPEVCHQMLLFWWDLFHLPLSTISVASHPQTLICFLSALPPCFVCFLAC